MSRSPSVQPPRLETGQPRHCPGDSTVPRSHHPAQATKCRLLRRGAASPANTKGGLAHFSARCGNVVVDDQAVGKYAEQHQLQHGGKCVSVDNDHPTNSTLLTTLGIHGRTLAPTVAIFLPCMRLVHRIGLRFSAKMKVYCAWQTLTVMVISPKKTL